MARFAHAAAERLEGARIVELGGGTGILAATLDAPVTIVEPHAGMAAQQKARGLHVVASLDDLRPAPTIFLANEVLDALPVHRLLGTAEGVREGYLDADLREVPGPLSPELAEAAKRLEHLLPEGAAAEVCLDAQPLLAQMARAAPRGYALFLDYGDAPEKLNPAGTLRGFREHRVVPPFEAPGEHDITADVDFPWIATLAQREGWRQHATTRQRDLLADLGLVEDMMGAMSRGDHAAYLAGKNLLVGMGERFGALLLARDAPLDPPLPGFRARGLR
ncbi:MAG: dehydrogenase [ubiquinone] 1 alpha subcomplex assembly factor 7 [Thermoplasmata archaeon]|jgi:SAM-dependent MidA family methyltransferase|nr:dehydrogenase [ubiquinone] 1 alpha subcomplex assembly factor 7 [Thermoplasmata archaeon]